MKRRLFISGRLAFVLASFTLVGSVPAQQQLAVGTGTPDNLDQAVLLLASGQPQEAMTVIASIDKADPNYGTAVLATRS